MPARCIAAQTRAADAAAAAADLAAPVRGAAPSFGFIACSVGYDVNALRTELARALPGTPFVGVTSCQSVVSGSGLLRGQAASALWLTGARAAVVSEAVTAPDEAQGRRLAKAATAAMGATVHTRVALFHGTPGCEESLFRGAGLELGPKVALLGGSAADDDISGKWSVFTHEQRLTSGAALALIEWPGKLAAPFVSGAMPTEHKGTVTRSEGRMILEIDGKPAAEVYNGWMGNALKGALEAGGVILGDTTLSPLGVVRPGGLTLVHPERIVLPQRALSTFAEVKVGETVTLVRSTKVGLQGRPANMVMRALGESGIQPNALQGVLLVYCAGCMLAIEPSADAMVSSLQSVIGKVPMAGAFHFGEQGCPAPGRPEHGNLMTGALLLA
ncbi:MAG: FIST C-terminal domain-containing protein [Deltaproteobacteria bacterium]|nr:FIST C-terminal domain-containing protein [Deltaproteobacteria bacterium]